MSIYDKASLVHIPSGYRSGTLYNVLPNNADGDFDFSRGSTGTRVNKDGLIETVASGVPRLDYPLLDGVVQDCPTLLLEPSRSNSITYSEDFSNASWTKSNSSVSSNQATSPDGGLNAYKFIENNVNTYHRVANTLTITNGVTYSTSIFVKKSERKYVRFASAYGSGDALSDFDLENGVVLSGNGEIENYGNGWFRISNTFTADATFTSINAFQLFLLNDNQTRDYLGDGTSGVYIWGAQVEQGSYPTSIIKTEGSTVTRSADAANGAEATFNDSEGVLYANIAWINNDLDVNSDISLSDNSTSNRVLVTHTTTENQIEMFFRGTGSTISQFFTLNDTSDFNKFAIKYKSTNFDFYINGFKVFESNAVATVSNLFDLSFDNPSGGGTRNFYGNTKELMTFNEALSDSELEALTSYSSFNEMATEQLYTIE
jgi:hypothetical protein